jgi:hypothetical protein
LSAVAAAALQQVQQQLEACWGLGLASGVQGVLEGLLLECRALLSKGGCTLLRAAVGTCTCQSFWSLLVLSGTCGRCCCGVMPLPPNHLTLCATDRSVAFYVVP